MATPPIDYARLAREHGGTKVTPPESDYAALARAHGGTTIPPSPSPIPASQPTLMDYYRGQSEQGLGMLKGLGSTLYHTIHLPGEIGTRLRSAVTGEAPPAPRETPASITPVGPAQQFGFHVEQLGEFLAPLGLEAKAAKLTAAPRIVRAGVKMAAAGTEAAAKTAAQGGDAEDVVSASLVGAGGPVLANRLRAAGKVVSETVPEYLYARIFPIAERDWQQAVAKQAKGQIPDPTVARQVLETGLFGSVRNMGVYVTQKLNALETELAPVAAQIRMTVPQKNDYVTLLRDIHRQFGRGAFSRYAAEASRLQGQLQRVGGNVVTGTDALAVKRFLDSLRTSSAFRMNQVLSARQDELKGAADLLRSTLRQRAPEISQALDQERVFIEAFESLTDQAVKQGRRGLIDFMDVLGGGLGGFGAGLPGGAAMIAARRAAAAPFSLTAIGQGLYRAGQAVPRGATEALGRLLPGAVRVGTAEARD